MMTWLMTLVLGSVWLFNQTLSFAMITIWSIVCLSFLLKDGIETLRQKSGKHNNWINLSVVANEDRGKEEMPIWSFPLCSSPQLVIFRPWREIPGAFLFLLSLPLSCSTEGGGGEKADTSLTTIVDSRRGRTLGEKECLFPVSSLFFLLAYLKC